MAIESHPAANFAWWLLHHPAVVQHTSYEIEAPRAGPHLRGVVARRRPERAALPGPGGLPSTAFKSLFRMWKQDGDGVLAGVGARAFDGAITAVAGRVESLERCHKRGHLPWSTSLEIIPRAPKGGRGGGHGPKARLAPVDLPSHIDARSRLSDGSRWPGACNRLCVEMLPRRVSSSPGRRFVPPVQTRAVVSGQETGRERPRSWSAKAAPGAPGWVAHAPVVGFLRVACLSVESGPRS
jgi:hypothetical protein